MKTLVLIACISLLFLTQPCHRVLGQNRKELETTLQNERAARLKLECLADVLKAQQAWREDDISRVRELMDKHIPAPGRADHRGPEWHQLHAQYGRLSLELQGSGKGAAVGLKWSPDGRWLALVGDFTQIWDSAKGVERFGASVPSGNVVPIWSPDARWLALSAAGTIKLLEATKGTEPLLVAESYYAPSWSPDSQRFAVADKNGAVQIWDMTSGKKKLSLEPSGQAKVVAWSPNGNWIAAAGTNDLKAWDANTGKELTYLARSDEIIRSLAWSPDGKSLGFISGIAKRGISIVNGSDGKVISTIPTATRQVSDLTWGADGRFIVGAEWNDGRLSPIWEAATGKELTDNDAIKKEFIRSGNMYWSPDGRRILVMDNMVVPAKVEAWNIETKKQLFSQPLKADLPRLSRLEWSPDGRLIAAFFNGHRDHFAGDGPLVSYLQIWDGSSGEVLFSTRCFATKRQESGGLQASWSPDSKRLAVASFSTKLKIRIFDASGLIVAKGEKEGEQRIQPPIVNPPTNRVGVKELENQIQSERDARRKLECLTDVLKAEEAWRTDDLHGVRTLMDKHIPLPGQPEYRNREWHDLHAHYSRHLFEVRPSVLDLSWLGWSPDGKWLHTAGAHMGSTKSQRWSSETGKESDLERPPVQTLHSWSPNNRWLAYLDDKGIWIAESTKDKKGRFLEGSFKGSLIWNPKSELMAAVRNDGLVSVWDVASATRKLNVQVVARPQALAWSPDGRWLAAAGAGGLKVWDASAGKELYHRPATNVFVYNLAWSPDGKWLGIAQAKEIQVLEAASGKIVHSMTGPYIGLAWSPDGRYFHGLFGNLGPIWEVASGNEITGIDPKKIGFPRPSIRGFDTMKWSPDGRRILLTDSPFIPAKIMVMDLASGKELFTRDLKGAAPGLRTLVWSPDSQLIAAAFTGHDHAAITGDKLLEENIQIWDGATGNELVRLRGFLLKGRDVNGGTRHMVWSPDSKLLAIGNAGVPPRAKVFDVSRLKRVADSPLDPEIIKAK